MTTVRSAVVAVLMMAVTSAAFLASSPVGAVTTTGFPTVVGACSVTTGLGETFDVGQLAGAIEFDTGTATSEHQTMLQWMGDDYGFALLFNSGTGEVTLVRKSVSAGNFLADSGSIASYVKGGESTLFWVYEGLELVVFGTEGSLADIDSTDELFRWSFTEGNSFVGITTVQARLCILPQSWNGAGAWPTFDGVIDYGAFGLPGDFDGYMPTTTTTTTSTTTTTTLAPTTTTSPPASSEWSTVWDLDRDSSQSFMILLSSSAAVALVGVVIVNVFRGMAAHG